MDEYDITPAQAKAMRKCIGAMVKYLGALQRRMDERGFPASDRFRQTIASAYGGVHALSVALHYMSWPGACGENRGRERVS